jgi:hypothetical protein
VSVLAQDFFQEQEFPVRNLLKLSSNYRCSTKKSVKNCSPGNPALKRSAKVKWGCSSVVLVELLKIREKHALREILPVIVVLVLWCPKFAFVFAISQPKLIYMYTLTLTILTLIWSHGISFSALSLLFRMQHFESSNETYFWASRNILFPAFSTFNV